MAEIKLTKTELRVQQNRLGQLQKYLPTLQLKKAMLQLQVNESRLEIIALEESYQRQHEQLEGYSALLLQAPGLDLEHSAKIDKIHRRFENIAGVDVPYFDSVEFHEFHYDLFDTPSWLDAAIAGLRSMASAAAKIQVAKEKKTALEKELREVSIRVNLFKKSSFLAPLATSRKSKCS